MIQTLSTQAQLVLAVWHTVWRGRRDPLGALLGCPSAAAVGSRKEYQEFVAEMLGGGLEELLVEEYPVLGRQLVLLMDQWVVSTTKLAVHLAADIPLLTDTFWGGRDPGLVAVIETSLSDRHDGGRSVARLTFASGARIIYKPRSLAGEVAFSRLCDWLNEHGLAPALASAGAIDRETYGWAEDLAPAPVADQDAVQRFFLRAGMLVGLLQVLEAADCHRKNIIAHGEHPVLVDCETLVYPEVRSPGPEAHADRAATDQLVRSILRSGMVPLLRAGPPGSVSVDDSGLGGDGVQATGVQKAVWSEPNTDRMRLCFEEHMAQPADNLVLLDGQRISPAEHVDTIATGLRLMQQYLAEWREELLAPEGPLAPFAGRSVRFLFRNTASYARMLQRLRAPRFLRDGALYGLELESFGRAFVPDQDGDTVPPWAIFQAECEALERLDIPFFTTGDGQDLKLEDGSTVADFFEGDAFERVRAHFGRLGDEDQQTQVALLRAAMHANYAADRPVQAASTAGGYDATQLLSDAELVAVAHELAEQLDRTAIRAGGTVTWILLDPDPFTERLVLRPMSEYLYSGRVGIACFLSALAHVSDWEPGRELALAALRPARQLLDECLADGPGGLLLGAGVGLGGILYGMIRVGGWLAMPELQQEACRAVTLLSEELIHADEILDVMAGAAGAMLGLLTVYEVTRDEAALAAARRCGEHLLNTRVRAQTGPGSGIPSRAGSP